MVTMAPATAPPLESETVPRIVPVTDWAEIFDGKNANKNARTKTPNKICFFISFPPPLNEKQKIFSHRIVQHSTFHRNSGRLELENMTYIRHSLLHLNLVRLFAPNGS